MSRKSATCGNREFRFSSLDRTNKALVVAAFVTPLS
jgi:hypothetical protein